MPGGPRKDTAQHVKKAAAGALARDPELIRASATLAGDSRHWPAALRHLDRTVADVPSGILSELREEIAGGGDPLGDAFCRIRSPLIRRPAGATYTPFDIVEAMVSWAADEDGEPARIVDPGAGSGRFIAAAAERFPRSQLVAVEIDPVAALMILATAEVRGFADRLTLDVIDYRRLRLPRIDGATLFIGNPPYVRHHDIEPHWKDWYGRVATSCGVKASKLAGLHLHFYLKTMTIAQSGDIGTFITAAEWLDVNYGQALRRMLAGRLGGAALHVLDPAVAAFPDAAVTTAITCFQVGRRPAHFRVRAVRTRRALNGLTKGRSVRWSKVEKAHRWSNVVRPVAKPPADFIELGELFRVHRGQVTGANHIWIAGDHARKLPAAYLLPTVTRAHELLSAGPVLDDPDALRKVIDLPTDLDEVGTEERIAIVSFLAWARRRQAHSGYIAQHRRPWWSVRLRTPAPIVCTYMARRPPVFVRNTCGARLLNIAHGLYPRERLSERSILALVTWLNSNVRREAGRVYAGGLAKFEPGEVERIPIPRPEHLHG